LCLTAIVLYVPQRLTERILLKAVKKLTDDYGITLTVNDQMHKLDKTFHQGETKKVSVQNFVDMDLPITVALESKKQFTDSTDVTYDQLVFEIQ